MYVQSNVQNISIVEFDAQRCLQHIWNAGRGLLQYKHTKINLFFYFFTFHYGHGAYYMYAVLSEIKID